MVERIRKNYIRFYAAIKSKRRSAYLALFLKLICPATRLIDMPFRFLNRAGTNINPIFIISSPRSGSTVIFQYLVRSLKVGYPSNWSFLFPNLGTRIRKNLPNSSLNSHVFMNYYGYSSTMSDVNEANYFFKKLRFSISELCL